MPNRFVNYFNQERSDEPITVSLNFEDQINIAKEHYCMTVLNDLMHSVENCSDLDEAIVAVTKKAQEISRRYFDSQVKAGVYAEKGGN